MDFAYACAGVLILALVLSDLLTTVLQVGSGGGIVTRNVTGLLWRALLYLRNRPPVPQLLRFAGVALTLSTILMWIAGLWGGWWLIYLASDSITETSTGQPADFWDTGWYAGYLLFTLGNGDFRPETSLWQMLSILTSMGGLALVTLSITYLMPVVQAVTGTRAVASYIDHIGSTPEGILLRAWNGRDLSRLAALTEGMAQTLATVAHQHLAYPVLHYFHTESPREALAPRVAALDEALLIAEEAVAEAHRADSAQLESLRRSIDLLLNTLAGRFVDSARETPAAVPLTSLVDRGLNVDENAYQRALERTADRRRALLGFVESAGWHWDEAVWLR